MIQPTVEAEDDDAQLALLSADVGDVSLWLDAGD
jgi:hypothetical protein